jgi:hypothetical protein
MNDIAIVILTALVEAEIEAAKAVSKLGSNPTCDAMHFTEYALNAKISSLRKTIEYLKRGE